MPEKDLHQPSLPLSEAQFVAGVGGRERESDDSESRTAERVLRILERARRLTYCPEILAALESAIGSFPNADPIAAAHRAVFLANSGYRKTQATHVYLDALRYQSQDEAREAAAVERDNVRVTGEDSEASGPLARCTGCRREFPRSSLLQGRCDPCYEEWADTVLEHHERDGRSYYTAQFQKSSEQHAGLRVAA